MLRRITIECPQCGLVCSLHLGTAAPVVVVRCPSCSTSLMSWKDRAVVLAEDEVRRIRHGEGDAVVLELLSECRRTPAPGVRSIRAPMESRRALPRTASREAPGVRLVTHDDVLDLHLLLEYCPDAGTFIDLLRGSRRPAAAGARPRRPR